jgi:hypothetical protein
MKTPTPLLLTAGLLVANVAFGVLSLPMLLWSPRKWARLAGNSVRQIWA